MVMKFNMMIAETIASSTAMNTVFLVSKASVQDAW